MTDKNDIIYTWAPTDVSIRIWNQYSISLYYDESRYKYVLKDVEDRLIRLVNDDRIKVHKRGKSKISYMRYHIYRIPNLEGEVDNFDLKRIVENEVCCHKSEWLCIRITTSKKSVTHHLPL